MIKLIFLQNLKIPSLLISSAILLIHLQVLAHADTVQTLKKSTQILTNRKLATRSDPTGYQTVAQYFKQRFRPKRHFLNIGFGLTPIESLFPFQPNLTKQALLFYINYRFRNKKFKKVALIGSVEYRPYLLLHQMSLLMGVRYPLSSDLKIFYSSFLFGLSFFPTNFFDSDFPLEFRLLFSKIISPKHWPIRFYLQGGIPVQLKHWLFSDLQTQWLIGLSGQVGVDIHL